MREIGGSMILVAVGISIFVLVGMAIIGRWEKWAVFGAIMMFVTAMLALLA
ncbi:hypothetical protein ACFFQF_06320 [Haladaptatus pallidirubidus]|uniref:Major facilitator superfamily (MFS) profile domain-containing protein n=1 Tax=Haladaptatus pallidirubidus TaxID=1008152 RepID=A0AAV3ULZ1_9EURY|nr:hypothetical protein [Haladaptatus pallidirubidus]